MPGHESHQLVLVLPPRDDGKLWESEIVWTASKPVEVVVLHWYDDKVVSKDIQTTHRQPLIAKFSGTDKYVAITLYKVDSSTPVPSGRTNFVGSALAFHNINGEPFTVTYSVKAVAFEPRQ